MKANRITPILIIICFILASINVKAYEPGQHEETFSQLPGSIYYVNNDNYNQKKLQSFQDSVNLMPEYLQDYFRQEGVKVFFAEGITQDMRVSPNGSLFLASCTECSTSYNDLSLKVDAVFTRPHIYVYEDTNSDLIIHEYGHAYDMIAGFVTGTYRGQYGISGQDQWIKLYKENKNILKNIDADTQANAGANKCEAFAESFRLYFTKPDTLKRKCPDIYHFVEDTLSRYRVYLKPITSENFDSEAYLYTYPEVADKVKDTEPKTLWNYYCQKGKALGHKAVCKIPKH